MPFDLTERGGGTQKNQPLKFRARRHSNFSGRRLEEIFPSRHVRLARALALFGRRPSECVERPSFRRPKTYATPTSIADFHTSPLDPPLLRQLLEHRLGLLQVQRIEAFGEPAIDRCKKIAGLLSLAPITPELRHARRGA